MKRWLVPLWVLVVAGLLVGAFALVLSGHAASSDADAARRTAASIEDRRHALEVEAASFNRDAKDLIAQAERTEAQAKPVQRAVNAVVDAFTAYSTTVEKTRDAQRLRTDALNRAVDAANAKNSAAMRTILDTQVTPAATAATDALAKQVRALARVDAALAALRKVLA